MGVIYKVIWGYNLRIRKPQARKSYALKPRCKKGPHVAKPPVYYIYICMAQGFSELLYHFPRRSKYPIIRYLGFG